VVLRVEYSYHEEILCGTDTLSTDVTEFASYARRFYGCWTLHRVTSDARTRCFYALGSGAENTVSLQLENRKNRWEKKVQRIVKEQTKGKVVGDINKVLLMCQGFGGGEGGGGQHEEWKFVTRFPLVLLITVVWKWWRYVENCDF
jgi:hypothetical protein